MPKEIPCPGSLTASEEMPAEMVAMNEALLLGALRQHELKEAAEHANALLQAEIAAQRGAARGGDAGARVKGRGGARKRIAPGRDCRAPGGVPRLGRECTPAGPEQR